MTIKNLTILLIAGMLVFAETSFSQETEGDSASSPFTTGADIYSSYIWRGTRQNTSPAIQPYVEFSKWGLSVGAWGSFDANGFAESDLYINYEFPFGLSLGVTNYYYSELEFYNSESHAIDISAGFAFKGLSLSASYVVNEAGEMGSTGEDVYFEAGYAFPNVNFILGAGNGWYTSDGEFNFCNIGIGTEKEIKITDHFSIPVTGQVILNPERESFYVVIGLSF